MEMTLKITPDFYLRIVGKTAFIVFTVPKKLVLNKALT